MSRKFNLHRFPLALAAVIAAVGAGAGAAHAQGIILPPVSGDTTEMTVKCEPLTIVQTTFISCKASLTSDTLRTPTGTVHWSAQRIVPGTFPPEPIAGPAGTFEPQSCGLGDDGFRRAGCSSRFTPDASAAGGTVRVTGLYMSTSDHDTTSAHYTLLVEAPANADSDGDGVVDSEDAFPHDINEQKDSDLDGTGDNADVFPNDAGEISDGDGDGVGDNGDNCRDDANFDQADLDSDDAGDVCDSDIDGDGAANGDDAFPMNASESLDSDGDGVGDNADRFPNDAGSGTPKRSASSRSREHTRVKVSAAANSTRLRSALRSRRDRTPSRTTATRGCSVSQRRNSTSETVRTSTASTAVIAPERGSPSSAGSSPTRSPGPQKPSTASRPAFVVLDTRTRPFTSKRTRSPISRSASSCRPRGNRWVRPCAWSATSSSGVSRPSRPGVGWARSLTCAVVANRLGG